MQKQILTLHPDYRECILDIDIFGRIISTPQQSLDELTQTLFEEFKNRNPMPTLESRRYELSRPVSKDYQISYDKELELQDGESLVDLPGGISSMPPLDFEDLTPLIPDVQECFRYEDGITDDVRQLIIQKFDLSTGEEFKLGIRQTENIVGSTEEDKSSYLSDEEIERLGQEEEQGELAESAEDPSEVEQTSWGSSGEAPPWMAYVGVAPNPEVEEDRVVSDEWNNQEASTGREEVSVGEESQEDDSDALSVYGAGQEDLGEEGQEDGSDDLSVYDVTDEDEQEGSEADGEEQPDDGVFDIYGGEEDGDYVDTGQQAEESSDGDEEESDDGVDYGDIAVYDQDDESGDDAEGGSVDEGESDDADYVDISVESESEGEDDQSESDDSGYVDIDAEEEPEDGSDDIGAYDTEGGSEVEGDSEESDDGVDFGDLGVSEDDGVDFGDLGSSEDSGSEPAEEEELDDGGAFDALDSTEESSDFDDYGVHALCEQVDSVSQDDSGVDFGDIEEPEFIPAPASPPQVSRPVAAHQTVSRPVARPQPQQTYQASPVSAPVVDRSSEPTDIRAFVRKHPRCDIQFALQFFTKKQIDDAVKLGRIIKKGNILR